MRPSSDVRRYRLAELSVRLPVASRLATACQLGLLLLIVSAASMTFVWLRSGTERLSRELQAYQEEFRDRGKEYDNLRVEHERFTSGEHILRRVAEFPAGRRLHRPFPGQVRRVAVQTQPIESDADQGSLLAGQWKPHRDAGDRSGGRQ